jgi:hypothetical protein
MKRIGVRISDGLHADLLAYCERTGCTLTDAVETHLRNSLDSKGSDRLLLLRFDEGLWAWFKAYVTGWGLWGSREETAIFMIRSEIIAVHQQPHILRAIYPHLPESIQAAVAKMPLFKPPPSNDH